MDPALLHAHVVVLCSAPRPRFPTPSDPTAWPRPGERLIETKQESHPVLRIASSARKGIAETAKTAESAIGGRGYGYHCEGVAGHGQWLPRWPRWRRPANTRGDGTDARVQSQTLCLRPRPRKDLA